MKIRACVAIAASIASIGISAELPNLTVRGAIVIRDTLWGSSFDHTSANSVEAGESPAENVSELTWLTALTVGVDPEFSNSGIMLQRVTLLLESTVGIAR